MNKTLLSKYRNIVKKELTVLFAEDNPDARIAMMKSLSLMFKKVVCVQNGEEAIQQLKQHRYDLIITDINMPKMDGSKLIKTIRSICKTFPIIITTAHHEFEDIYSETPNIVVLKKPIDIHQLIDAVNDFEKHNNIIEDDVYDKLNEAYNEARKVLDMLDTKFKGK